MKAYHTISRDTSARPDELKLKVGDMKFQNSERYQYAEAIVNGKAGRRQVPLINSIPYLKDYLQNEHLCHDNMNLSLFCGKGKRLGQVNLPAPILGLYQEFRNYILSIPCVY